MKVKKKEAELAKMEKIESELINKLKNTEKLQTEAVKKLEEAIKQVSPGPKGTPSPKSSGKQSPTGGS